MKLTPRKISDGHEWAIIHNVDSYDLILISLIDGASLLNENGNRVATFKKNSIVTKRDDNYTYDKEDLLNSFSNQK